VLDLVVCFFGLIAVSIILRVLISLRIWIPALGAGADPVELWRSLGFGAKLSIFVAFVLTQGPIYWVLFEASAWQATLGKRALGIYVFDGRGQRISMARSCGRSFAKWFFGWFGGSFVSAISIAITRKALHDYAASTHVIKGRPPHEGRLEIWRIITAFGVPFAWTLGAFLLTL
jgi:uncharacterized RDD family membrane protein YckC